MEEKDVQIKGYKIRLPLDVVILASANPEDYTSRGRIITPLKDRFDVQIRTHYPRTAGEEIAIVEQEAPIAERSALPIRVPQFLKEIVAHMTMEARGSSEINQASGVSVRVTINNYETLISNAEKRAVRTGEPEIVPRLSDLPSVAASTIGKVELEYGGEEKGEGDLVERLINRAILKVWDTYLTLEACERIVAHFEAGWGVEVSDRMRADEYQEGLRQIPGLQEVVARLVGPVESPGLLAAATELVLEGLHLHQKLNRTRDGGRMSYRA
jgi:magnesium chelatase subunit I